MNSGNILAERKKYLSKYFGGKKPLGIVLHTGTNAFLYDTGTNKILNCDPFTYDLILNLFRLDMEPAIDKFIEKHSEDCFLETVSLLERSIDKHNLFGLYEVTNFDQLPSKEELIESISTSSEELGLEVTEGCNLRCLYCVHQEANKENRNHGSRQMAGETAFAAIDFLAKNSLKSKQVTLGFYGGEPLLNFPVIKESVRYAREVFKDKPPQFNLTTNGTLITPEIARFFAENQVDVRVSIDGPEDVHNRYRKNIAGDGSFNDVREGLQNLFKEYGESFAKKINLYMVYAPPYSVEEIKRRIDLWQELDWLPEDIRASLVYYSGPRLSGVDHKEDKRFLQWAFEEYFSKTLNTRDTLRPHPFSKSIIEHIMAVFSQRPIYHKVIEKFPMHACCMPAKKRIFVTVGGDFRVCEKIPFSAPSIGSLEKGIDFDLLYHVYLETYKDMTLSICKKCWAINTCDSCFIDGYSSEGLSPEKKADTCKENRNTAATKIFCYCKATEVMPNLTDHFGKIKLS